ncbi:MAG: ABC transporter ATP-binding protein [Clostridia bacterium]|nr:ABC transporter ATP-binding protein [Clostridia bacterium]
MKNNKNEKRITKNPLMLMWNVMTRNNKWHFFALIILGFITSAAILIPTQMISLIISKLSGETVSFFGFVIDEGVDYITVIVVAAIITYIMKTLNTQYSLSMEKLIKRVVCNIRIETFKWLIVPRKNMDLKMTDGDALYRMNEGPEYITNIVTDLFSDILPSVFSGIIAFVYICLIDVKLAPFIIISLFLVFVCVIIRTKIERTIATKTEKTKSAVSNTISNSITNLPIINLYKSMFFEEGIFKRKIEDFYTQQKKQVNLRIVYWSLVRFIEVICTFGIIFFCAKKIIAKELIVGSVVVITNYVATIFNPVKTIGYFSTRWVQCSVKINRLYEIKPEQSDLLPIENLDCKKINSIELKNINIQNGDIFKIKDVNMRFEKGKMTVIYGESGCGKSTVMKVLCGLCEKLSGDIVINDNQKIPTAYIISNKMSVTMQSPYIFNRDVKFNVLYPDGQIYKNTKDIVELFSMQKLYNRKFNEDKQQNLENMLSGGEKKRVCIARGLLKPAEIYIFDEPTNDLDSKNADNVINQIKKLKEDAIVIVVSHDDRVIKQADQIIKMQNKVMLASNDFDDSVLEELEKNENIIDNK